MRFNQIRKISPQTQERRHKVKGISGVKPPEKTDESAENEKHMIRKIGVISDTHIPEFKQLPPVIWEYFDGVERIIHAGDLSVLSVIAELKTISPVTAVQGNIEEEEVVRKLPIKREIMVGNCHIGIVHILGDSRNRTHITRQEFPTTRMVIFGHSHIPWNEEHNGQLLFN